MSEFCNVRYVRAARRPCRCEQCGSVIQPGERKLVSEGMWDGDFFRNHEHVECMFAKVDYHDEFMGGRYSDEPWPSFWRESLGLGEYDWIRLRHPIVATRMGLFRPTPTTAAHGAEA